MQSGYSHLFFITQRQNMFQKLIGLRFKKGQGIFPLAHIFQKWTYPIELPLESISGKNRNSSWIIFFNVQFELNLYWFELATTRFESNHGEF